MDAEALVSFRRSCKLLAAAESVLLDLINCSHSSLESRKTLRRNLAVIFNAHSTSMRKMAVLAEKAAYVPRVTVSCCNDVAKLCAESAVDMNKYFLKVPFIIFDRMRLVVLLSCLVLAGSRAVH